MRASKALLATIVAVLILATQIPLPAAISQSEIDQKVSAVAAYKIGVSPEPLTALEDLIRRSQQDAEARSYLEKQLAKLLESDQVGIDSKLFICRQLWVIGTDESISAIAKLLSDETTADMACYAIGQNPSPKAGQALRDALATAPAKVKIRIINLLGDRRDAESAGAICKLAFAPDTALAEAAITALGKIGGDAATSTLLQIRSKGSAELRQVATDALLRCAEGLPSSQAVVIYRQLAQQNEPPVVRSAAIKGLADRADPNAVSLIVAALNDANRMIRTTARSCVRTMQGAGLTEQFAAQLGKVSADERVLLITALADRGDPAALNAIINTAGDANPQVRRAVILAVGKLGDAAHVDFLVHAASSIDQERTAALAALTILRGDGVDEAIAKEMQKAEPVRRVDLIGVLYDRNATITVPFLLQQAKDHNAKVHQAAFRALGRLAEERDLPVLVSLLIESAGNDAREAERAVATVARKTADQSKQADVVLRALANEKRAPVRCSLLRTVGSIANDKSLEPIVDATNDTDKQVKDTAIRELAKWPNAQAAPALLRTYQSAPDQTYRLLALRALVRVLSIETAGLPTSELFEYYMQAMPLARDAQEKRLILSGLANVRHPCALAMLEPLLKDDSVKTEAQLAAVKIAAGVAGSAPARAKTIMQSILSTTTDDSLRQQAQDVLKLIESFEDYITAWQVAGPYVQAGKNYQELFDIPFAPEEPDAQDVKWQPMPAGTDKTRPYVLDLLKLFGGEQRVAYLRTSIHGDKEQQALLEMGSDDGLKVWLNGSVVHVNNVARALTPGSDKVTVTLRQGWNQLLVKVTQNNQPWEFCARLRKPDGTKLDGIRIDATRQEH
jgi:HEAT repeat protein